MSSIEQLRARLSSAREALEAGDREGLGFSGELARSSLQHHVTELDQQLRQAVEARGVEILELRLDGPGLQSGSIPLELLSKVGKHVSAAIRAGVQRRRTGMRVSRLSRSVSDSLDLRLTGVSSGSTRLTITGAASVDLFGMSDLEEVLERTFELLRATDSDDLQSHVSDVGIRTAREVSQLAEVLAQASSSLEVSWRTPANEDRHWAATPVELGFVAEALGGFEEQEPEEIQFQGTTVTLSSRGRFEIDVGGKVVSGSFPSKLQDAIKQLRIGEAVVGTYQLTRIVNSATERVKTEVVLLVIASSSRAT